ncbi:phage terminase small subunit P27 family [Endozoicomonas acroporae]|uniref:phage terminase small subunit P27 family n=1 Tax=Endozoicomonas acroporae TaxID=1701104 RepID=UPI0013D75D57|nr:phage terminase small subunit P27 family [Endozoicomonas acroporae]
MGGKATVPGRGRKPKPSARKKLAGNPGKRKLNDSEPAFTELTHIDPPEWLSELAVGMWETVSDELCREGVLNITDLHNLEAFCSAYGNWRTAQLEVIAEGPTLIDEGGKKYKNPAMTAANEAMKQMATFGSLLGLDPSSRQRLIGGNKEQSGNRFSEF